MSNHIPVLTYHSVNVNGMAYGQNDHVALASDLNTLVGQGWRIIPLKEIVAWQQNNHDGQDISKTIGISFDDGSWFDYYDLEHPAYGPQRSFINILDDFRQEHKLTVGIGIHATSFVICSPDARTELDRKGLIGEGWWGDEWWTTAQESGLISIECHSWDHDHPDLDRVAQRDQAKGDFRSIDNLEDCMTQVAVAGDYIEQILGSGRPSLYAYPWGQFSEFMVNEYMPGHSVQHGFVAAFGTDPRPVSRDDNPWALPRYVCGRDWSSSEEFEMLLNKLA